MTRRAMGWITLVLIALSSSACLHMNIRTIRPAPHDLGPVDQVVLVQGQGREDALQVAGMELLNQVSSRGFFGVRDARHENLRMLTGRNSTTLKPAPNVEEASRNVYVRLDIVEWSASPTVATRTFENEDGEVVTQVSPVLRGRAVIRATILAADGQTLLMAQTFTGGADTDVTVPPPPAAEIAGRNAVAALVNLITPIIVTESVRIDKSDKQQMGFIETANQGLIEQAATDLDNFVRHHPNNAVAHYNLAVMLDAIGEYEQALEHYDRAMELGGRRWYGEGRAQCARRLAERGG